MSEQKAEGPRGGGGGGGRLKAAAQPTPTELLALADELDRMGAEFNSAWPERIAVNLRTLATTLSAREDQPEVVFFKMTAASKGFTDDDWMIRIGELWFKAQQQEVLPQEEFIAACKASSPKAPIAGEGRS